jgi:hypothetical protein
MSSVSDKVVVVTGASSGIGRATALELAKRNAKVACLARREDRLSDLSQKIKDDGGKSLAIECDVTDRSQVSDAIETATETFGPVDILVANAGVMPLSFMDRCDVEGWDQMIDVNIKGVLYSIAAVLPSMLERESGHIVPVSSVAGRRVMPGGAVYCATKHAVHALAEGLRSEVATKNIRVTTIAPGFVSTELQQAVSDERILKRWEENSKKSDLEPLTSEDIALAIAGALEAPARVSVNEVLIRPTRQEM